jgi:hypothetical protein
MPKSNYFHLRCLDILKGLLVFVQFLLLFLPLLHFLFLPVLLGFWLDGRTGGRGT